MTRAALGVARRAALVWPVFATLWGGAALAGTEPATLPHSAAFGDWQMACPGGALDCAVSTTSFADDRTWLSTIRMQPASAAPSGDIPVQILVPPQVHLASGIFVEVPGMGRRPARYIRCSAAACDARLSLEVTDFQAWKGAREAVLTYRPTTSAPPIRFAVSLMGLTAAFEAARMEGDHDR